MDRMPLLALFLQSIPEGLVLVALGLVLVGIRPRFLPVVGVAVAESVVLYFIRSLPIPFGVHTLCAVAIIAAGLRGLMNLSWRTALLATTVGGTLLLAAEGLFVPLLSELTGVSREAVLVTPWLRVVFPLPYEAALAALAWCCWHYGWSLLPREEGGSEELP